MATRGDSAAEWRLKALGMPGQQLRELPDSIRLQRVGKLVATGDTRRLYKKDIQRNEKLARPIQAYITASHQLMRSGRRRVICILPSGWIAARA